MRCQRVALDNGTVAMVCGSRPKAKCPCGNRATLLCDWKDKRKLGATCDKPLCASCTTSPAPDKDLCPAHAAEFEAWKAKQP